MKILVTAGATMVMIDKVRAITNIFKGRTGNAIALEAVKRGHKVTLLTSNPLPTSPVAQDIVTVQYKTYDQLAENMLAEIASDAHYDAIIHSAAVSDYRVEGTYQYTWNYDPPFEPVESSKKISSTEKELYLKLVPTEKLIDKIRDPWGFKGKLVKFKLQVGITDDELTKIAIKSMLHSRADMVVANCLEWSKEKAFIIYNDPESSDADRYSDHVVESVKRDELPSRLLRALEQKL
jgi:phosphopantothenate-cysteine ligase/phosphopantothenoylcysteine decarboxylase/phosphopantothenate--cysteine ligase